MTRDNAPYKLTAEQAQTILDRYAAGETQTALAAEYGVSRQAVSQLVRGGTWSDLDRSALRGKRAVAKRERAGKRAGARTRNTKLDATMRRCILYDYDWRGITASALAKVHGVHENTIRRVVAKERNAQAQARARKQRSTT